MPEFRPDTSIFITKNRPAVATDYMGSPVISVDDQKDEVRVCESKYGFLSEDLNCSRCILKTTCPAAES